jgi:drug/metabolite transporter (DMT)-like permease
MTAVEQIAEPAARRFQAMGLMVLSSIGISFGGLVIRSMQQADAWQINFYRSMAFVAAITLFIVIRYRGETAARIRSVGRSGVLGGAMLASAGIFFLQAITNTTVANTLFTLSAIPFFTAIMAWVFLRESLRGSTLATMIFAAIGIGVMMLDGLGGGSLYGNLTAVVTALCFSGFTVIVRRHRSIDMLPTLMISGLLIIPIAVALRWGDLAIPVHDVMLCFLLGGVLSGIGNVLFIAASRYLAAAELTLFMLLEFALGPIWVWVFINETPTGLTVAGGTVVILAVTARALFELRASTARLRRGRPSPM